MNPNRLTLLLLEDSDDDELLLLRHLRRNGFEVVWERVQTAAELLATLPKRSWNLVISDYHLSGGFTASAALSLIQQSQLDIPFIVVSDTIGESLAVALMKAGANDYLMKNNLARLSESIRRELREADIRKQRRRAEAELSRNQTQTRAFLKGIPDIILLVGADGVYQEVVTVPDDRWLAAGDRQLRGRSIYECLPESLALLQLHYINQALQTGHLQVFEQAIDVAGQPRFEEVRVIKSDADEVMLMIRDITERKQAELKLAKRDRYLTALVEIQQLLLSAKVDHAFYELILPILGEVSGADRTYVLEQATDGHDHSPSRYVHEWCAAGVSPQFSASASPSGQEERDLSSFGDEFHTAGTVNCPVSQLPSSDREHLAAQGTQALLEVPIVADGEIFGIIGLHDCQTEKRWDPLEADMVRSIATAIALAKEREQSARALAQLNQELEDRVNQRTADLRDSEARLQAFLNFAPSIIYVKDLQGRYTLVNHAFLELFACRSDEVINRTDLDLFETQDAHTIRQNDQQILADEEFRRFEETLKVNGKWHTFLSNKFLLRDPNGHPSHLCGISIDITERQEAQKQLAASEEKFRNLVEHANDIIYILDSNGIFTYVSPNWTEVLGHTTQEVFQHSFEPFVHPEDVPRCVEFLQKILDTGQKQKGVEYRVKHKQGDWRWHTSNASPQYDGDGNIVGCLGIAHDVSDRKRAEAELRRTNAQLARATQLKDEFLANMSHELRTPLNAILGMTEGLQEQVFGPLTDRQTNALDTIERSSTHLLTLINDILDLSKVEAGQMELHLMPTSVSAICQTSLSFIRQQALKKNIQLHTEIPAHLPEIVVDERRITQVLINLLSNAVKFTPSGGTITLKVERRSPDAAPTSAQTPTSTNLEQVRFAVIDTGIGIAPQNLHKLFRPFVQIDGALNRRQMGTGLGLALVKRIAQLHGGQVNMTSEVGVGSCFFVDLPCLNYCDIASPTSEASPAQPAQPPSAYPQPPHLLLAEDNEANLSTLSSYLRAKGYELILAKTGREAVEQAQNQAPDLILMDVQMPEMDGLEAMRLIRQLPGLARVPIIALTALAMTGDRDRCLAAGANQYMSKPVKLRELVAQIQTLLAHHQPQAAHQRP